MKLQGRYYQNVYWQSLNMGCNILWLSQTRKAKYLHVLITPAMGCVYNADNYEDCTLYSSIAVLLEFRLRLTFSEWERKKFPSKKISYQTLWTINSSTKYKHETIVMQIVISIQYPIIWLILHLYLVIAGSVIQKYSKKQILIPCIS